MIIVQSAELDAPCRPSSGSSAPGFIDTGECSLSGQPYISHARGDNEKRRRNIPSGQIRQVLVFPGGICNSPMKLQDG